MNKSEAVSQYLEEINSKKEEPKGKDGELIKTLKNIQDQNFTATKKMEFLGNFLIMIVIFLILLSMISIGFYFDSKDLPPKALSLKNNCILINLFLIFSFILSEFLIKVDLMMNVKKTLGLIMDKPYEVRVEHVNYYSKKVKIIIEENLTSAGGVIKEKSKHITAYSDLGGNRKDLVNFLFELAQKAEDSFSTSKKS